MHIAKMIRTHHRLILASGSISRRTLLEQAGLTFEVLPSAVDEGAIKEALTNSPPEYIALELAKAKALQVSDAHPDALVIGGDQICALQTDASTQIFDKPGDEATAAKHLSTLCGTTHQQYSAVCIYRQRTCLWSMVDKAELTMRQLDAEEIASYIKLDQPTACAGAYKFEALGCHLFSHVHGSAQTIQGLPLLPLLAALRELNVYSLA